MIAYRNEKLMRAALVDCGLVGNVKHVQVQSLAEMRPAFERIDNWMRFLGYPRKDLFAVRLALEEAVANALQHGHDGAPDKAVRVTYAVLTDEVFAEVSDPGVGFDPDRVPNPLAEGKFDRAKGLGLFLMKAYASWVSFTPPGNCVTLGWRRSAP